MSSIYRLKTKTRHIVIFTTLTLFMIVLVGCKTTANGRDVPKPDDGCQLVTTCSCPAGQELFGAQNCITSTGCSVVGAPNQVLQGGYLIKNGVLYKIDGKATCKNKMVCASSS
jgi:hypothetical protein